MGHVRSNWSLCRVSVYSFVCISWVVGEAQNRYLSNPEVLVTTDRSKGHIKNKIISPLVLVIDVFNPFRQGEEHLST